MMSSTLALSFVVRAIVLAGMSISLKSILFSLIVLTFLIPGIPFLLHCVGMLQWTMAPWTTAMPGTLTLFLGVLIYIVCARDFARFGRGTPAVWDPPKTFVSHGLYRLVRNPMYLGIVLIIIGEASIFHSRSLLVIAVSLWLLFHGFVLFYEEPTLIKKFGDSYRDYCFQVSRWLPRWPR
jgi:protein-S-isoprenylcysteine O-methyltransferase Ste14